MVTSFEFRLHEVSTVYAGAILWPLEKAADAMKFYGEFITNAPEDLNAIFAFLVVPPGPPFPEPLHNKNMCGAVVCWAGPSEKGEGAVKPLREFGPPLAVWVSALPDDVTVIASVLLWQTSN